MIKRHLPIFFLLFFVLGIYLHNAARSIYGGDVGDLVTAASLMGVAHPPGYPLFTLLGYLLAHIPFFFQPQVFLVGIISIVSSVGGLLAFYGISYELSKNRLSAFLSTAILAFSFLYWFYAEIAEVFALNSFFASILFLVALLYRKKPSSVLLFILAFLAGLSLTNHQTIILIFPSLLLLIGKPLLAGIKISKKSLLFGFTSFLAGLLPYVYIPLAASHHPIINWDNVHDLSSFFHLVLRQDYGTFQAGIFEKPTILQRLITLRVYSQYIISQITIPVFGISMLGLGVLWKRDTTLFLSLLLAILLTGPAFIAYAGFPLTGSFILGVYERFFILSSVMLLIPFSVGIVSIAKYLSDRLSRKVYITIFQIVFFFIPLMLFIYNFPKTNLSGVHIGETYVEDMLMSLPPHALLVFNGDTLVFNTWYVHYVRHVRPDVSIYNIGGELQNTSAGLLAQSTLKGSDKSDKLLATLIENTKVRPVFSTILFQPTKNNTKITWVPYGLSYQLVLSEHDIPEESTYLSQQNNIWRKLRLPTQKDKESLVFHNLTISEFPAGFSDAALGTGTFIYTHYHNAGEAMRYYQKAISLDQQNAKAYETLGTYYMGVGGKCNEVVTNLSMSLSLNPFEKLPYFILYATYKDCFHKDDMAKAVTQQFHDVFQQDFSKEVQKQLPNPIFSQ